MNIKKTKLPRHPARSDPAYVIMSIKPDFANQILSGKKRVEFRRSWAKSDVHGILLYSSSPVKKFVGIAYVEKVVKAGIKDLWRLAQELGGGVSKIQFDKYFDGKEDAYAIIIKSTRVFDGEVSPLRLDPKFRAPQSYCYLSPADFNQSLNFC